MDIFEDKKIFYVLLFIVFMFGVLLRINYLNVTDYRSGADEGFYLRYADYMAQEKGASIRALVDEYTRNKEWQAFPSPLRAGHILISMWWMKAINHYGFEALSFLSGLFSILTLFVGYIFAKKLFDKKIAFLTLVLLTVSPLGLAIGRRALQDSIVSFFVLTSLYLFYEALNSKNILWAVLFTFSFYASVMIKETSILLAVFFIIYILHEKLFIRKNLNIIPLSAGLILTFMALGVSYGLITSGLSKFLQIVRIILISPATNEYAIQYQSGSFLRYLGDFFLVSPLTMAATVFFCGLYIANDKLKSEGARYVVWLFIILYIIFSFFSKNLRYVMALDLPIRIFTALAVSITCSKLGRWKTMTALCIILAIAFVDFRLFKYIFITQQVYDPVTYELLTAWKRF